MRAPLHASTIRLLRRELARGCGAGALLGFAEAVVQQVSHPVGAMPAAPDQEQRVAAMLLQLLLAACQGGASEEQASLLANDPALLSACFQNADLLRGGAHPGRQAGDAVSLLLITAVDRLRG